MLTVATIFWQANESSFDFSRAYNEEWVERVYRGFARNLTKPFRFVCFSDRPRTFREPIEQEPILATKPDYSTCIEPYRLDAPMILVGLDTVITGNCDALADYCLSADVLAVPLDPYNPRQVCNGVALVPAGQRARMWDRFDRKTNDMEWIRANPYAVLDDLFPGQITSYKGHVKKRGLGDSRIVYFHGLEKPPEIEARTSWVREHWR